MTIVYMHYFGFVQGKGTCHLIYEMLSSQISALHIKTMLRTLKKEIFQIRKYFFLAFYKTKCMNFLFIASMNGF